MDGILNAWLTWNLKGLVTLVKQTLTGQPSCRDLGSVQHHSAVVTETLGLVFLNRKVTSAYTTKPFTKSMFYGDLGGLSNVCHVFTWVSDGGLGGAEEAWQGKDRLLTLLPSSCRGLRQITAPFCISASPSVKPH